MSPDKITSLTVSAMHTRTRRKDGIMNSKVVSPWFVALLPLVILAMNYQAVLQLERSDALQMQRMHRKVILVTQQKRHHDNTTQRVPKQSQTYLSLPIPPRPNEIVKDLVKPGDYIYYKNPVLPHWDAAPIVIESHKLIFFTIPKVGCTVWKQLFRRMMGYKDWQSQDYDKLLPHNPATNGLKYLYDYSLEEASEMMSSPEWTRAIMVRDPKRRFLSAFLDKAVSNDHLHIIHRCCPDKSCVDGAQSIPGFLQLIQRCDDEHWLGQHARVDSKYWPYMDDVGHVETAAKDAKRLLQKIGAWDEFGASGWGEQGSLAVFQSTEMEGAGEHATFSQWKVWQWYTPESEKMVERFYQADYLNPLFKFDRGTCLTCPEPEDSDTK